VLLVLGERAMNRFVADAPDLADWYAASFEFESAVAPAGARVEEVPIPERSSEWIESRITLLQDQLRGTLRDRTRARVLMELADLYRDSVFGVPLHPDRPRLRSASESLKAAEVALREAVDLQRDLARRDPVPGPERDLARALDAMARLLETAGRYAEAQPAAEEALRIRERVLGEEHPETLTSINNLAYLYERQGRYAEAEPLYQRALAASERVLGREHAITLTSVNNQAHLYASQGRYAEAEPLYQRVLSARERVLGEEHPDTLTSVNNLAQLYESQGRCTEAEPLYQRALAARERELGGEHPDTLTSVNNLAGWYARQGRFSVAEPLLERAVSGAEKVLGHDHPHTRRFRTNLEALRSKMSSA
jgi:tetratricopeptide (TPR) repeat protein